MKGFGLALLFLISIAVAKGQSEGFKEGLKLGDMAAPFSGTDQNGELVKSEDLCEKGKIVLVFYRGTWCPYCKKHISELQENMEKMLEKGANVVIVTPEKPEYIKKMVSKTGARMSIIYDEDYKIMRDYKVDFKISEETVTSWKGYVTEHTRKNNGNDDDILPIPATYIINPDGKISYVQFDPDYKNRSSAETILKELDKK